MTIQRGPDSDIQLHSHQRGRYVCHTCKVSQDGTIILDSVHHALAHVQQHINWGHKVPPDVVPLMEAEIEALRKKNQPPPPPEANKEQA